MKKIIALSALFMLTACGDNEVNSNNDVKQELKQELKPQAQQSVKKVETSDKLKDLDKEVSIAKTDSKMLDGFKERIELAQSDVSCDTSAQCYVVSTGVNPCGGASGYAVLSSKTSNKDEIEALTAELIRLEKSKHALEGTMGICQHLFEPKGMCKNEKCVAVDGPQEVY